MACVLWVLNGNVWVSLGCSGVYYPKLNSLGILDLITICMNKEL